MTTDDPKFTAYALDELEPGERDAIAAELENHPEQLAELHSLQALAARLRAELATEMPLELTAAQRAEMLATALAAPILAAPPAPARSIVPFRQRAWLPSAIAACLALGLGVWFYHPATKEAARHGDRDSVPREMPPTTGAFTVPTRDETAALQMESPVDVGPSPAAPPTSPNLAGASRPPQPSAKPSPAATPSSIVPSQAVSIGELHLAEEPVNSPPDFTDAAKLSSAPPATPAMPSKDATIAAITTTMPPTAAVPFPMSTAQPADKSKLSTGMTRAAGVVAPQVNYARNDSSSHLRPSEAPAPGSPPFASSVAALAARAPSKQAYEKMMLAKGEAPKEMSEYQPVPPDRARRANDAGLDERNLERDSRLQPEEPQDAGGEAYVSRTDNPFVSALEQPLSTFSIDVDTASYTNTRRMLQAGQRPPRDAVKIEEMLNFFTYDYPPAPAGTPCSVNLEVASCPWSSEHRLLRVGLKAREIPAAQRPAANLVFLLDVSGSMNPANRLPLARQSLRLLTDQLGPEDRVSIVVYAGSSGTVLEPTSDKAKIRAALDHLQAGGSTNGAEGIQLAYRLARKGFVRGQINRVILATDGDFNVGVTNRSELVNLIKHEAKSGVFLTVLGFGYGNLKDATLEQLADSGNGNYAYVNDIAEGRRVLVEQMGATLQTVAKDVKIQIEFNPAKISGYRLIGYEKRMLQARDFTDDTKDAGEMGSGHTVTALYELVPAGSKLPGGPTPPETLKYQAASGAAAAPAVVTAPAAEVSKSKLTDSGELLTLKLRWKDPEGDRSDVREYPLTDAGKAWSDASVDFRWASAVAGFGMLLRDSPYAGSTSWSSLRELAQEGKGADKSGYRQEMISLIEQAQPAER